MISDSLATQLHLTKQPAGKARTRHGRARAHTLSVMMSASEDLTGLLVSFNGFNALS